MRFLDGTRNYVRENVEFEIVRTNTKLFAVILVVILNNLAKYRDDVNFQFNFEMFHFKQIWTLKIDVWPFIRILPGKSVEISKANTIVKAIKHLELTEIMREV